MNYKALMAYLCSGMSAVAYQKFCNFFETGMLKDCLLQSGYHVCNAAVIDLLSRQSAERALAAEVAQSGDEGMSVTTDARHHCRKKQLSHQQHCHWTLYT